MDTASMALAPRRLLFSVPSRSIRVLSRKACSGGVQAQHGLGDLGVDVLHGLEHALAQIAALSPSRSSMFSREPVGCARGHGGAAHHARFEQHVALDGGLPRLSSTSRPTMSTMALMEFPSAAEIGIAISRRSKKHGCSQPYLSAQAAISQHSILAWAAAASIGDAARAIPCIAGARPRVSPWASGRVRQAFRRRNGLRESRSSW